MKFIGLTLGLLVPLLVCSSPINDESQATGIHIFLEENGAIVDEEIKMDKENDVMVVNVPSHHDRIESKSIYDMKSPWMMQVLPEHKECLYMRTPSAVDNVKLNDARNIKASSKENPIKVSVQNTITLETSAIVGPTRNRSILPENFQHYCPQDFDVRSTHLYEIGKKDFYGWDSDEIQFGSQEDFFDNGAPQLIEDHTRRKRALGCQMFGQASDKCNEVIEARCGNNGYCPIQNVLYHCQTMLEMGKSSWCNFLTIPCAAAEKDNGEKINSEDMAWCLLHMSTVNESCSACCRDPACSGSRSIRHCPDE